MQWRLNKKGQKSLILLPNQFNQNLGEQFQKMKIPIAFFLFVSSRIARIAVIVATAPPRECPQKMKSLFSYFRSLRIFWSGKAWARSRNPAWNLPVVILLDMYGHYNKGHTQINNHSIYCKCLYFDVQSSNQLAKLTFDWETIFSSQQCNKNVSLLLKQNCLI